MKFCTERNALLLKKNNKLLSKKENEKDPNKRFVIIIDRENLDRVDDILKGIRNIEKKRELKKSSKKTLESNIKTGSKKDCSKTGSKKTSIKTVSKKECSKTGSKKTSIKSGSKKNKDKSNIQNIKVKKLGRPKNNINI